MSRNGPLTAPVVRDRSDAWRLLRTDVGPSWASAAISMIALWVDRGRSRRALAGLDDYQLRDIGITRADARLESEKPFWMP
jgi:uncharacterized protein YjiS (DUF1127 family)